MSNINWDCSREDFDVISDIADRALNLAKEHGLWKPKKMEFVMDLVACHMNGCPLDLFRLLVSDEGNFGHDIFGIRKHINRENGKLEGCFLPRFAARQVA